MKLIIHIYPDEDGIHCGGCLQKRSIDRCFLFRFPRGRPRWKSVEQNIRQERLPGCLKAEAEAKEKA